MHSMNHEHSAEGIPISQTVTQKKVDEALLGNHLLDEREMRELFPDGKIIKERFLGIPKSLIAMKQNTDFIASLQNPVGSVDIKESV